VTPLRARLVTVTHALHCLVGDHAWTTEVPNDGDGQRSTTIRQRCLYCARVSPGIEQAGTPSYHYSPGMERPAPNLVLHNGRLRRCPCLGCEERRRMRRQKRDTVAPIRRSA
jgi:hypothetical protein